MAHRQLDFEDQRNDLESVLKTIHENRNPLVLILDGLQSPGNIGAIFRLADAARLEHIYLFQCSSISKDRKFLRSSRSTQKYVSSTVVHEIDQLILLKHQYHWVAVEKTDQSTSYQKYSVNRSKKTALILGNEMTGVRPELLVQSEKVIHIPMLGVNTSMNVVSAAAIAIYKILESLQT